MQELTQFCSPIMTKMHQQAGGDGRQQAPNCGQQAGGYKGPTVEEVD